MFSKVARSVPCFLYRKSSNKPPGQSAFFDFCAGNRHQIVVDEICESNTKIIGCADGSRKSGSTNRALKQVWHILHVMLWFGTCAGENSENDAGNIFPAHYKECSLAPWGVNNFSDFCMEGYPRGRLI